MQGVHAFDPKVKTTIDLESFVAEDHFLRRIDRRPALLGRIPRGSQFQDERQIDDAVDPTEEVVLGDE